MRDQLARDHVLGGRVTTLAGLAARLAGGLGGPVTASEVRRALQEPPLAELTSLQRIAGLPGFARAAAATLQEAWHADLDLGARAGQPGAHERWAELAALERHVAARLAPGVRLPREVVGAALERVELAPRLLGRVTLERVDEVPPLYRRLLAELPRHVEVMWRRLDERAPDWLPPELKGVAPQAHAPELAVVSCADPAHEALEALRWVRRRLAGGVPASQIAVAAVDVAAYDDAMRTLGEAAGLPLHAAHGVAALATPAGQFAAALADALQGGPDQARVRRLVAAATAAEDGRLGALPDDWCAELHPDAALGSVPHWRRALAPLRERAAHLADLVTRLVVDLAVGPLGAAELGPRWLSGAALELWRRALTEGPAEALPLSLQRLRVSDGADPATAVVWGSAASLLGWPRAHVRLLGLSARSWPRRGSDEDPLLPARILGGETLAERSPARRDADHLRILLAATPTEVVLSRPRRGSDGRKQSPSPLLRPLLLGRAEVERLPRQGTDHALSEADRRACRRAELAADPGMNRARRVYRSAFEGALGEHDGVVRPAHPVVLRALARRHSATSLRKLLLNPHGFVASYALGWAQPQPQRELLKLEPVDRGSLLHEVLERSLNELQQDGGFSALDSERSAAVVERVAREVGESWARVRPVPPPLAWRAELGRAQRTTIEMLACAGEPYPNQRSFAELKFGFDDHHATEPGPEPLWQPNAVVTLPGTGLRLRGVIDRLDLDAENRRVRVIDYKSGKARKLEGDLDRGAELQRTLYTAVVKQLLGEEYRVEAGLLHAGESSPVTLTDPEASLQQLSDSVAEAVSLLERGRVLPGPGLTDRFEETLLAHPAVGPEYYYKVKRRALGAERARLDALLGVEA